MPGSGPAGTFGFERRLHQRYPLTLDVEYNLLKGRRLRRKGFGRTTNISSIGVFFEIDDSLLSESDLLPGGSIRLSINWPCLLNGSVALRLVMYGKIVRVLDNTIAVGVNQHAFRVAGLATT
jgi:hypothetical protein